jgi:hypothetical protein
VRGHLLLTANRSIQVEEGGIRFRCRGLRTYDQLDADSNGTPRLVRETLEYCTEEARIIPQRAVRRGQSLRYPFEFTISEEGMPTHHGNVCAVRWGLQADVTAQRVPPIRPPTRRCWWWLPHRRSAAWSGEYRAIGTCDACHLLLSLPRAVFSPETRWGPRYASRLSGASRRRKSAPSFCA